MIRWLMQPASNILEARVGAPPRRRSFLTPGMFAVCIAAWVSVAAFLWFKDALFVGPTAPWCVTEF